MLNIVLFIENFEKKVIFYVLRSGRVISQFKILKIVVWNCIEAVVLFWRDVFEL